MKKRDLNQNIIEGLRKHDPKVQELFYKTYAKLMFITVYRYIANENDSTEVLNDGFYKVFSQIEKFREGELSDLISWTRKIMINESLQTLRKRNKLTFTDIDECNNLNSFVESEITLESDELYDLINGLPTKYRTVFNLYIIEGYNHNEISKMLSISENTSRSILLRARLKLQDKIKAIYSHDFR